MNNSNIKTAISNIQQATNRIDIDMILEELELITIDSSKSIIMLTHKDDPEKCIDDYLERIAAVIKLMRFLSIVSLEISNLKN